MDKEEALYWLRNGDSMVSYFAAITYAVLIVYSLKQATGRSPKNGKLSKIFIRNFGRFKDDNIINLNTEDDGPLTALVGSNGAGKSTLLRMISSVNVLRYSYTAIWNDGSQTFSRLQTVCDCIAESATTHQPCRKHQLSRFKTEKNTISKPEDRNEGMVAIESHYNNDPVFYGLYSGASESSGWQWHTKNCDSYAYSTAFFVVMKEKTLYLLNPRTNPHPQENKFFLKFAINTDGYDCLNPWKFLADTVRKCAEDPTEIEMSLHYLPLHLRNQLPSSLFSGEQWKEIKEEINWNKTNNTEPLPKCLLIDIKGWTENQEPELEELKELKAICLQTKIRVILSTASEGMVNSGFIGSMVVLRRVNHTQTRGTVCSYKTFKVHSDDLAKRADENNRRDEDPLKLWDVITSSMIIFVEGKSDFKVLDLLIKGYMESESQNVLSPSDNDVHTLLRNPLIYQVEGKDKIYLHVKAMLQESIFGPFHLSVCDGDAIVGGSAEDISRIFTVNDEGDFIESGDIERDPERDIIDNRSIVHKDGRPNCVLYIILQYIFGIDGREGPDHGSRVKKMYEKLINNECCRNFQSQRAEANTSGIVADVARTLFIEKVFNERMPFKAAWAFSENELFLFAWKYGTVEDMLNATNRNTEVRISNRRLRNMGDSDDGPLQKAIKDSYRNGNIDVKRLFSFFEEGVETYIRIWNPSP